MTNQIQQYQMEFTPAAQEAFNGAMLDVMKQTLAPTASHEEFVLFAHKCAAYGLDPFKSEVFFIKYGGNTRIQFAAEAYLTKAREHVGFEAPDTQMVHENDIFRIGKNPETQNLEVVQHDIGFPRGQIIGAYSIAYRNGFRPVTVIMDIAEVQDNFKGSNATNWKKYTADMFGKHVQQRALKRQYGLNFDDGNLGYHDEQVPEYKSERKDITPVEQMNETKYEDQVVIETPIEDPILVMRREVSSKLKQLRVDKDEITSYINRNMPSFDFATAQLGDYIALSELLSINLDLLDVVDDEGDSPE